MDTFQFPKRGSLLHVCVIVAALFQCVSSKGNPADTIFRHETGYRYCTELDDNDDLPTVCSNIATEFSLFPNVFTNSSSRKIILRRCGADLFAYNLFTSGPSPNQIFRSPIEYNSANNEIVGVNDVDSIGLLNQGVGLMSITSFDITCGSLFFSAGNDIWVQNLDVVGDGNIIAKVLYRGATQIQHLEVGSKFGHFIYFSINSDGLYRMKFDGSDVVQILAYGSEFINDFDYNPNYDLMAIATSDSLFYFVGSFYFGTTVDLLTSPMVTRFYGPADATLAVSIGTTPGPVAAYMLASIDVDVANMPIRLTTRQPIPSGTITDVQDDTLEKALDLFVCASPEDCSVSCDEDDGCGCLDEANLIATCCRGLCVGRDPTDTDMSEVTCHCRNENSFTEEACEALNPLNPLPSVCPADLIGAITCSFATRDQTFSMYALSLTGQTRICAVDVKGQPAPLPAEARLISTPAPRVGYTFIPWRRTGARYGRYEASYEAGESSASLEIIVQEGIESRYANYVTVSAEVGSSARIRLWIPRQCNIGRIRWRIGKKNLLKYKGRASICFNSVSSEDAGLYEAYFNGRGKSNSVTFVRLITYVVPGDAPACFNGGLPNIDGIGCVCPPSWIGNCFEQCPKGMFGSLGVCHYTCVVDLGMPDCSSILFCLPDPLGCVCYPGYQLPDCKRVCEEGYFGQNCAEKCECDDRCDPFDGECFTDI